MKKDTAVLLRIFFTFVFGNINKLNCHVFNLFNEFEENEVRRANGKPKQKNSQEKTEGVRLLMLETKDLVEEEEGRRDVE